MSDISVNGVVQDYFVKPVQNGSFLHAVTVEGSKYSAFTKDDKPRANIGDTVEFKAVQNDKGYFNIGGAVKVLKRAAGHQQGATQQYAKNENKREASIFRQNAMTQANAVLKSAIDAGIELGVDPDCLDTDMFAKEVIRLADAYFFPYAQDGTKPE